MEIKLIRKNGVPASEVEAHQRIQEEFDGAEFTRKWRGYASFSIARKGAGAGDDDFDLVLVTHTNIVVLELKNWNGRKLLSNGQQWFVDGSALEQVSPVNKVRLNAKKLANLLKQKLGPHRAPFVSSYVVLCGKIDAVHLHEDEQDSVLTLDELLTWKFFDCYRHYFPQSKMNPLEYLSQYDEFFGGMNFKPKDYLIDGFKAEDTPIFIHPNELYREFRANAKDDHKVRALMRQWDFSALGTALIGEPERAAVGLREQRVFDYVVSANEELSLSMMRPVSRKTESDVTMDYAEVFFLPSKVSRLAEFSNNILPKLTVEERVTMVKTLLNRFSEMHDLQVAHKDIGDHSLWLERPAKVIVSDFAVADYPGARPLSSIEEDIRVTRLPQTVQADSAFKRDVYMLGSLAYLILFGEKPTLTLEGLQAPTQQVFNYSPDVAAVLSVALGGSGSERYTNARAFLEAFNKATDTGASNIIDITAFDAFKAQTKERDYDEDEMFIDTDKHVAFRSGEGEEAKVVRVWFGVEPDPEKPDASLKLLAYLERLRILKGCGITGLPKVLDFGLSKKSLLLVQEYVEGKALADWLAENPSLDDRIALARLLTDNLQRLHSLELSHGDIRLSNIVVRAGQLPVMTDVLNFAINLDDLEAFDHLPSNYKSLTPFERDRYSLAGVLLHVFGAENTTRGTGPFPTPRVYRELANVLKAETLTTLLPLSNALQHATDADIETIPELKVIVPRDMMEGTPYGVMPTDNGSYHIQVHQDNRDANSVRVYITGIGRLISFSWNEAKQSMTYFRLSALAQSQLVRNQNLKDVSLKLKISIVDGPATDATEVIKFLWENEFVKGQIERHLAGGKSRHFRDTGALSGPEAREAYLDTPIPELWQFLMDAEENAFYTVTVAGDKRKSRYVDGQILVPYHADKVFEFTEPDEVLVENLNTDGVWMFCGRLNLRETTAGENAELAIDRSPPQAVFRIGTQLRMVSTLEKASFTRRRAAVDRILQDKAVIPGLIDYLEPQPPAPLVPMVFPTPTEEELDVYAASGKPLNESQRDAFKRVLTSGPISLLQGPPGTGKTWFIAALLHYLMTKAGARRILLVSQAHEAVNNALEKGLELCRSLDVDFNAVRLGNESASSDAIKHLHSTTIEQTYRERFKAERKERVSQLAKVVGLPGDFAGEYVDLHMSLGNISKQITRLQEGGGSDGENSAKARSLQISTLITTFAHVAKAMYTVPLDGKPADIVSRLEKNLIAKYGIISMAAIEQLKKIFRLSEEWVGALGSSDANFSEFLGKSRTVVAGTLVGIGYRGAGIVQNIFDWVIIDEAGRAAPSELAVAMQAGHRVLLVGDHHQLPPTFSEQVKAAARDKYHAGESSKLFESDFHRIFNSDYGKAVGSTLLKQYRMAPAIGELVSSCFYDGELQTGRGSSPEYYRHLPKHLSKEVSWIDTSSAGFKAFEQETARGEDKYNTYEARVIMQLLRQIVESVEFMEQLEKGLSPQEPPIGIVCMYSKQREIIDQMKAEATWLQGIRHLVKVDTVDSYQGKENRIVILSTVRNNPREIAGFLSSPNRTNVAMSRAMERLFIVGAKQMWTGKNVSLPLGRVFAKVSELAAEKRASIIAGTDFVGE